MGDYRDDYEAAKAALAERDAEIAAIRRNNRELTDQRVELMEEIGRLRKLLSLEGVKCCETCQHYETENFEEPCFRCESNSHWELKEKRDEIRTS